MLKQMTKKEIDAVGGGNIGGLGSAIIMSTFMFAISQTLYYLHIEKYITNFIIKKCRIENADTKAVLPPLVNLVLSFLNLGISYISNKTIVKLTNTKKTK